MSKLEEMREKAKKEIRDKFQHVQDTVYDRVGGPPAMYDLIDIAENELTLNLISLITEVRNETIKECEGCVPEEMEVTEPVANQSYSYNFYNRGHNSCREQTLQAIKKMYE